MGTIQHYTRVDMSELVRQGQEFVHLIKQNQGLRKDKMLFRSWLKQIERLIEDSIEAKDRMDLEEGIIFFRDFLAGVDVIQLDFSNTLSSMVKVLDLIRRTYTFKPTDVANGLFARFLRATEFEGRRRGLGKSISLHKVASTAKIDITAAHRCLSRLLDEKLGSESPSSEGSFEIDRERVLFAMEELERSQVESVIASGEHTESRNVVDPIDEVRELIKRWRKTHDWLLQVIDEHGSGIVNSNKGLRRDITEMEADASRLISIHAPWLQPNWHDAKRKTVGELDMIAIDKLVAEMKERLDLLEVLEDRMERTEKSQEQQETCKAEGQPVPPLPSQSQLEKPTTTSTTKKGPWKSGAFYLLLFVVIMGTMAVIAKIVPFYVLPIIIIGGLLFFIVISALQLRQDESLSETSFLSLIVESLKRMHLLK